MLTLASPLPPQHPLWPLFVVQDYAGLMLPKCVLTVMGSAQNQPEARHQAAAATAGKVSKSPVQWREELSPS